MSDVSERLVSGMRRRLAFRKLRGLKSPKSLKPPKQVVLYDKIAMLDGYVAESVRGQVVGRIWTFAKIEGAVQRIWCGYRPAKKMAARLLYAVCPGTPERCESCEGLGCEECYGRGFHVLYSPQADPAFAVVSAEMVEDMLKKRWQTLSVDDLEAMMRDHP